MQNEIRARRLWASSSNTNILAVREVIEGDHHITMWKIDAHVGISYASARSIISDDLGHRKVSARWVPRLSTEDQKANHLAACEILGTISNRGG